MVVGSSLRAAELIGTVAIARPNGSRAVSLNGPPASGGGGAFPVRATWAIHAPGAVTRPLTVKLSPELAPPAGRAGRRALPSIPWPCHPKGAVDPRPVRCPNRIRSEEHP